MVRFLFCSVVSRNDCKNYLFIFSGERRGDRTVLLQHLKVNNLSSDWRPVGSQRALLCQACDHSSKYFARHPPKLSSLDSSWHPLKMTWWETSPSPHPFWSYWNIPQHFHPFVLCSRLLLVDAECLCHIWPQSLNHLIIPIQSPVQCTDEKKLG